MGKVIFVTSGKGGTGKTMFAVNFGVTMAQQGCRVLLLDMDLGMRNMDIYLGMESKVVYNVMDVLSGVCRISKAITKVEGIRNLYFMAASPFMDEKYITPLHMKALCGKMAEFFDYVVIDSPSGTGRIIDSVIPVSDKAVIVTEMDAAALRDAETVEMKLMREGKRDNYIVINRLSRELAQSGAAPDLASVIDRFKGTVAGILQNDENIRISTNSGVPIVCKRGTYIEKSFKDIASVITEQIPENK